MHFNKYSIVILVWILSFTSCQKEEIRVLKKGKWDLEWQKYAFTQTGKLHFKGNGRGVFYPSGSSDKYPFNYSINGNSATFQFENPSVSNTIHKFDIVLQEDNYQVWEENYNSTSEYNKSTFVIKK